MNIQRGGFAAPHLLQYIPTAIGGVCSVRFQGRSIKSRPDAPYKVRLPHTFIQPM